MSFRSRLILVACFIVVAAVCARLGIWQVHRLRERRASNVAALAGRTAPPVVLRGNSPDPGLLANRRVQAVGRYDHAHDIVLRGKEFQGTPGVEIVSPLVLEGGPVAVLVNRGFVPAPDAVTVRPDSLRESGEKEVRGLAMAISSGRGSPLKHGQETSWARLDLSALRERLPYPIRPFYIWQVPDSSLPRFPRRLDVPPLDDGPHLSYAIQWIAFAIIALVFAGVVGVQGREG
jgi:surfeit locus 1 family protein